MTIGTSLDATTDLFQLFGEPTRLRLAALCAQEELSVADLVAITDLAQSRVSTHLAKLREAGVLRDRRVGASTLYTLADGAMPEDARRVWTLVEAQTKDRVLDDDRERLTKLLAARAKASPWPDAFAGEMERHYSPGRTWQATARAFVGLMRLGDVLDVGSGDGSIAQLIAPRAKSVTLVDQSDKMIAAAKERLAKHATPARFVVADAHELPLPDAAFDQVLLLNVLTHARTPQKVLAQCARVMRPGASLTLVTLDAHAQADVVATYRHLHPGFAPATLRRWLAKAGLEVDACEVTSRERQPPHLSIVTAFAHKRDRNRDRERR